MLFRSIIGSIMIFTLSIFSWKIVLISLLFLYIYYSVISKQVKKILFQVGKYISLYSPVRIKIVQESFIGFRDIIINGKQKTYFNLFNKYNSSIAYKESTAQLLITLPKFLVEGITLFVIAIFGYTASFSNSQNTEFVPLLGAFVYAIQRLLPLCQLSYAAWASYKVRVPSIKDILQELENNQILQNVPKIGRAHV